MVPVTIPEKKGSGSSVMLWGSVPEKKVLTIPVSGASLGPGQSRMSISFWPR